MKLRWEKATVMVLGACLNGTLFVLLGDDFPDDGSEFDGTLYVIEGRQGRMVDVRNVEFGTTSEMAEETRVIPVLLTGASLMTVGG